MVLFVGFRLVVASGLFFWCFVVDLLGFGFLLICSYD